MADDTAAGIDAYVGSRVRFRRMVLGMSQQRLGDELGISFQQVQKYEKGVNRITAGRLYQLAGLLGVEVSYFFDNAADPGVRAKPGLQVSATEVSIVKVQLDQLAQDVFL